MSEILKRTWVEVNIDAVLHNLKAIKSFIKPDCAVMGIVKADAYGHGAPVIAKVLSEEGIDYFGVSNLDEALQLRNCGIKEPILILGSTPQKNMDELSENNISQTVISLEYAKMLSESLNNKNKKINIHIKLDTGMSRLGLLCQSDESIENSVKEIIEITKLPNLICEGIFTHFSISGDITSNFTKLQFDRFCAVTEKLNLHNIKFKYRHCCNSAATVNFPEMQLDMVRTGILLYGLYPSKNMGKDIDVKPVMEFKTIISQIRDLPGDVSISYGRTYKTSRNSRIATMPIGYADGFLRILSNNAEVLINGKKANVVGRVCMDYIMIDVTDIDNVKEGQTVTIFGEDNGSSISIEELADGMETINYEICCLIGKRVPRIYQKGGKIVGNFKYIL